MPTRYARRANETKPEPEDNWLIWFDNSRIEGCENALILYGMGEIRLLKTVKAFGPEELGDLDFENWTNEDHKKWEELFGSNAAANELRDAYRHFRKVSKL